MDISVPALACCAREQEHCHDTVVLHADGTIECTGDACIVVIEVHDHVVPCAEVSPPCGCAEEPGLTAAA